jgi:hypothetical protein
MPNQTDKDTDKGTPVVKSKTEGTNEATTPSTGAGNTSQDDGFNGNLTAQEKAAKSSDTNSTSGGVNPQVNVGQNDKPKYANMPQTDYSKVQTQSHVTAVKDKIDQDGLLGGKKSTGVPHAVTAGEAEQKDLDDDEDSDDETIGTDSTGKKPSGSTQRTAVQGSTPNATGSAGAGSGQTKGADANKAGTLGSGKK